MIAAPVSELSPPLIPFCTALPIRISRTRSNGVNCPDRALAGHPHQHHHQRVDRGRAQHEHPPRCRQLEWNSPFIAAIRRARKNWGASCFPSPPPWWGAPKPGDGCLAGTQDLPKRTFFCSPQKRAIKSPAARGTAGPGNAGWGGPAIPVITPGEGCDRQQALHLLREMRPFEDGWFVKIRVKNCWVQE